MKSLWLAFVAATVGLGCLGSPAWAQSLFSEALKNSRNLPFEQRTPFGGIGEIGALSRDWSVNSFYTAYRGEYPTQTKFWAIRRVVGASDTVRPVVWADSRSCPAVEQTLTEMERLPAVRPDAPQLGEESENMGLVMDGTHHVFWNRWARSGGDDATVGLEITGNINSPIAKWWSKGVANLASCWKPTPPS
jgi:hypothetical protein